MKKTGILQKARIKLIKALGGYTCPPAVPQCPEKFRFTEEYRPERLVAFYRTPETWPTGIDAVKKMMVGELAKALSESGVVKLKQTETGFYGEIWVLKKGGESVD